MADVDLGANVFTMEAVEVIEEAYEMAGSEARVGYGLSRAVRLINITLQDWAANFGINLWKATKFSTILTAGQSSVTFSKGAIDILDVVISYEDQDYSLERTTRADYLDIPNKTQQGRPTEIYVERLLEPIAYLWPAAPTDVTKPYTLTGYVKNNITTITQPSDNLDIPSRFYRAFIADVAVQVALKIAPERVLMLQDTAESTRIRALSEDSERGSLFIHPAACR